MEAAVSIEGPIIEDERRSLLPRLRLPDIKIIGAPLQEFGSIPARGSKSFNLLAGL
jgi:hypothetical protein